MLQFDRIDVSEGNDINKTSKSKKCMLCHYWYFKDGYKFQPYLCNGSPAVSVMSYELKNTTKNIGCIFLGISRNKAVNMLNKSVPEDKGVL